MHQMVNRIEQIVEHVEQMFVTDELEMSKRECMGHAAHARCAQSSSRSIYRPPACLGTLCEHVRTASWELVIRLPGTDPNRCLDRWRLPLVCYDYFHYVADDVTPIDIM